ncbi:MAG: hypothetical protein LBH20_06980 [Treponema sp.]|jgi:hypothetical protein|nr:hypothetical protein [Treponema sp.]
MIQLYFLSIVFNGLSGFLFIFGDMEKDDTDENKGKFSFISDGFRLVIGILAGITGILKLLLPMGRIPILGDLLPAVAGIAAGFMLVFGFYREHSSDAVAEGSINRFGELVIHYKKPIGIILLASAALHFILPTAFLL